ncbi:uncharacterized protein LOC133523048 isoform X1 [Cydia pomonella]|uniref:uncharacterized protein LOC133523048 isoform X1 n=1 Tax=Cydia pomonella TaxID=82600 RepID=UPI002ADD69CA|nr:uncharacterized protein LOC133523048 isoform X1 [Cydia pomonella]
MAQFNYLNELNSLATTMDGPITRGPPQRWAKKNNNENINPSLSASFKNSSNINISSCSQSMQKLSISANQSVNSVHSSKTPTRSENKKGKKTPSKNKSPGRSTTPTPNKASKTPNKADRFIPSRSNSNYDLCHYMMSREDDKGEEVVAQKVAGEAIGRALTDMEPGRLLQYTCKAPAAPEGYQNRLRVVYSQAKVPSSVKNTTRYIPQAPDRILDAPEILDDYYLNLVDWSASNILAVALGNAVYLWNAGTGQIEQLMALEASETVRPTSCPWRSATPCTCGTPAPDRSSSSWRWRLPRRYVQHPARGARQRRVPVERRHRTDRAAHGAGGFRDGTSNILPMALGSAVYLWNAGTGQIEQLMALEASETVRPTSCPWRSAAPCTCGTPAPDRSSSSWRWRLPRRYVQHPARGARQRRVPVERRHRTDRAAHGAGGFRDGTSNILPVALGNAVYLWNAGTGQIEQLMALEASETVRPTSCPWRSAAPCTCGTPAPDRSSSSWRWRLPRRSAPCNGCKAAARTWPWARRPPPWSCGTARRSSGLG